MATYGTYIFIVNVKNVVAKLGIVKNVEFLIKVKDIKNN